MDPHFFFKSGKFTGGIFLLSKKKPPEKKPPPGWLKHTGASRKPTTKENQKVN